MMVKLKPPHKNKQSQNVRDVNNAVTLDRTVTGLPDALKFKGHHNTAE